MKTSKTRLALFALTLTAAIGFAGCEALVNDVKNDLNYIGGKLLSHPTVYAIYWSDKVADYVQTGIPSFLDAFLNSTELDWLSEYSINGYDLGRGSLGGIYTLNPHNTSTTLQEADFEAEIETQLNENALPRPPQGDAIYAVFVPSAISIHKPDGDSCKDWCAYHGYKQTASFGTIYYAAIMDHNSDDCRNHCAFAAADFDDVTDATSHELAEAITDPNSGKDQGIAALGVLGWVSPSSDEIGDHCNGQLTSLVSQNALVNIDGVSIGGQARPYVVQKLWDNTIHDCNPETFTSP
jgi:hypothetical protein